MKIAITLLLLAAGAGGALLTGCSSPAPADTGAGLNGLQQRALNVRNLGAEFDATYDEVWYSLIATLQLNGFILRQADKAGGYLYGVWQDAYESQTESSFGGFTALQAALPPGLTAGGFFARTEVYRQIEVSVTLEPLARTETLVRLTARFDREGVPLAEGVFANRFFGLVRKEIFLRKQHGSIYQANTVQPN